jgi:hypothetical protein
MLCLVVSIISPSVDFDNTEQPTHNSIRKSTRIGLIITK